MSRPPCSASLAPRALACDPSPCAGHPSDQFPPSYPPIISLTKLLKSGRHELLASRFYPGAGRLVPCDDPLRTERSLVDALSLAPYCVRRSHHERVSRPGEHRERARRFTSASRLQSAGYLALTATCQAEFPNSR